MAAVADVALDGKSVSTIALESAGVTQTRHHQDLPAGTHIVTLIGGAPSRRSASPVQEVRVPERRVSSWRRPWSPRDASSSSATPRWSAMASSANKTDGFSAATENERPHVSRELVAKELNAEMHNLSLLRQGCTEQPARWDPISAPIVKGGPSRGDTKWDFKLTEAHDVIGPPLGATF